MSEITDREIISLRAGARLLLVAAADDDLAERAASLIVACSVALDPPHEAIGSIARWICAATIAAARFHV